MPRKTANKTQDQPVSLQDAKKEAIANTGITCRFADVANSSEQIWSLLGNGIYVVSEIPFNRID